MDVEVYYVKVKMEVEVEVEVEVKLEWRGSTQGVCGEWSLSDK